MKRKIALFLSMILVVILMFISCNEAVSIVGASINETGELILEMSDGTTKNMGIVKGKDGANGKDGIDGKDGTLSDEAMGITDAKMNEHGELILTFTDGTTKNIGKVKGADGQKYLAHTLNNTVVAPPRMLIALLENNLSFDGERYTLAIPKALQPYMGGKEQIVSK